MNLRLREVLFSLLFLIAGSSEIYSQESSKRYVNPQGSKARLMHLYKTRDGVLQGLDNLARKVCFSSRIGWSERIKLVESQRKAKKGGASIMKVLPAGDMKNPGVKVVLPLKLDDSKISAELIRSRHMGWMLKNSEAQLMSEQREDRLHKGDRFSRIYYNRQSCLSGLGIRNACSILKGKSGGSRKLLAERKKLAQLDSGKFLERFDQRRACQAYEEKIRYRDVLSKIQKEISRLEKEVLKEGEGKSCPVQNKPICKSNESLVTDVDRRGCSFSVCKKQQSICPKQNKPICKKGESIFTTTDRRGCSFSVCKKQQGICPKQNRPICKEGESIFTTTDRRGCSFATCKERKKLQECPIYNRPICRDGKTIGIKKDIRGCDMPYCS